MYWEERKRKTQYYHAPFLQRSRYCVKMQCPVLWTFFADLCIVWMEITRHMSVSQSMMGWGGFWRHCLFCISNRLYGVTVTQGAVQLFTHTFPSHALCTVWEPAQVLHLSAKLISSLALDCSSAHHWRGITSISFDPVNQGCGFKGGWSDLLGFFTA